MPLSALQLRAELARIGHPATYEVTPATYENAEKAVLEWLEVRGMPKVLKIGPHGGLMFKGVELIMVEP